MGGEPMTQSEIELRIKALEQQVAALLPGSVAKKTVNGREYFYHRWTENKKRRKIYPHESSRSDSFTGRAEKGIGEQLRAFADPAKKLRKRECFQLLHDFIYGEEQNRVFILYGLRRTGKNDTDPSDFC